MKTTLSQVFGENVRKHRERCGYTQEQLAELLGVESRTLSRIECGDQGSKFATIEKISEVLKIEAWRLFDQKNDPHECDIETLEIYNDEISLRVASVIKVNEGKEYTVFTRNAKTRFERNRNQVKDESAPLRIQALSSTFRILLEKYPSTDPGVLWGNLQNAHVEIMRRVDRKSVV
jgi:transcriptional regulator with XRE-family HTH domain